MSGYRHVMYASKGAVEQVYSELYGDIDHLEVEQGSRVKGSVSGKLGTFFAMLRSNFTGELTKTEIKSINFDDDLRKAKKLANEILSDENIPDISTISRNDVELDRLYRFSCEVETLPFKSEIDDRSYIEVSGEAGEIRFRGDTSTENWGLRSHIVQSVRAAERGNTYPYQGLMWPLSKVQDHEVYTEYDVKFLIICGPERELMARWYDRRGLQ